MYQTFSSVYYYNVHCPGDYECQISTTPVRSLKFKLQVVGKFIPLLSFFHQMLHPNLCCLFSFTLLPYFISPSLCFSSFFAFHLPTAMVKLNKFLFTPSLSPFLSSCTLWHCLCTDFLKVNRFAQPIFLTGNFVHRNGPKMP